MYNESPVIFPSNDSQLEHKNAPRLKNAIIREEANAMLTNTLRSLEEEELVKREQFNEIPPHVEYSLTKKGRELMPLYYEIYVWGMKYCRS